MADVAGRRIHGLRRAAMWTAAVVVAVAALLLVGSLRWSRVTLDRVLELQQSGRSEGPRGGHDIVATSGSSTEDLSRLPAPVARYVRRVMPGGPPRIRSVEVEQAGEFRIALDRDDWHPFIATQHFATDPPGFVWDARIRAAPLVPIYVRDACVRGTASMRAHVLAIWPMVDAEGGAQLQEAALQRYLAESIWFPTALLPGGGVSWRAVDERTATAFLTQSGTTVSVHFQFSEQGDVTGFFVPSRFRSLDGRLEPTPWAGRCSEHTEREGIRIPVRCEVEWRLPDGPKPYWRGRITEIHYGF